MLRKNQEGNPNKEQQSINRNIKKITKKRNQNEYSRKSKKKCMASYKIKEFPLYC